MQTQKTENEKIGFNLEIEVNSDKNNLFSISLKADTDSYLIIKAIQKNDLFHKSFSNKFTMKQLNENRYFALFDNMKEIFNELSDRIKTKEIKLIENLNNLVFLISLPIAKIKEIKFELNKEEKGDKEKIEDLNTLVLDLKNEISELKNIVNKQNNEINELKNIVNKQNNEINELKNQIKKDDNYKIEKKLQISGLNNSLIIDNNIEYNKLIKSWIDPNKKIKAELLYRLSRDGESNSKFHQLCDNKGPTLTLFYTEDENKAGIYTPLVWDCSSNWKTDMETFIFILNKKQKYKKIQKDFSIYCYSNYGPWIYSSGFNTNQMKSIYISSNISIYFDKGSEILPNINSLTNVKEVEIYRIIL